MDHGVSNSLPVAPDGLSVKAQKLWYDIVGEFELRADGLAILHEACKALTRVEQMEEAMKNQEMVVPGSMRQPIAHPLLGEIRQTSALAAQLLARLKLGDVEDDDVNENGEKWTTVRAKKAANARWANQKGLR